MSGEQRWPEKGAWFNEPQPEPGEQGLTVAELDLERLRTRIRRLEAALRLGLEVIQAMDSEALLEDERRARDAMHAALEEHRG